MFVTCQIITHSQSCPFVHLSVILGRNVNCWCEAKNFDSHDNDMKYESYRTSIIVSKRLFDEGYKIKILHI